MAWDVARDMFLANVRCAGEGVDIPYKGADGVDYAALAQELPEIGTGDYAAMCNGFNDWFNPLYGDIIELRQAGEREAVAKLFPEES